MIDQHCYHLRSMLFQNLILYLHVDNCTGQNKSRYVMHIEEMRSQTRHTSKISSINWEKKYVWLMRWSTQTEGPIPSPWWWALTESHRAQTVCQRKQRRLEFVSIRIPKNKKIAMFAGHTQCRPRVDRLVKKMLGWKGAKPTNQSMRTTAVGRIRTTIKCTLRK